MKQLISLFSKNENKLANLVHCVFIICRCRVLLLLVLFFSCGEDLSELAGMSMATSIQLSVCAFTNSTRGATVKSSH
jgi:hypothetical protein